MYRRRSVLETEIFKVFYFKLFRSRVLLRHRKESSSAQMLGECLSFREVPIPNDNIHLIYRGYDSTVMFEMDGAGANVQAIWRECGGSGLERETFLGYPVFYDYKSDEIENRVVLLDYLKRHWSKMKTGHPCHGDMTHYNLLIDRLGRIKAIDEKPRSDHPILMDLFYFYGFFRYSLDKHVKKNSARYEKLTEQLDWIYGTVFSEDSPDALSELLSEICSSDFGNVNAMRYTAEFKKVISGGQEKR